MKIGAILNLSLALAVLSATALSGCSRRDAAAVKAKAAGQTAPVPVLVANATEAEVPVQLRAIGNVQAFSKVSVRSRITGQLQHIHFREGEEVHAGDLLFTIDPRPLQAALQQAQGALARDGAQAENARAETAREKKLFESKLISEDEYEKVRANLAALEATVMADQAAVSNAALNLEYTQIRSPIDGRTGNQLVHEGNIVKMEDDVLITINQVRPIYVSFAVPEQELPLIRERMAKETLGVEAAVPGQESQQARGELTFIDNAVDMTTGTIQLKATFKNEKNLLWPGQFVQASLTVARQLHAIVVPSEAIQTGQNGSFVFVVDSEQRVEPRPVVEGITFNGRTVVQKGLNAGEMVVTDGQLRLVPKAKVSIKFPGAAGQLSSAQSHS